MIPRIVDVPTTMMHAASFFKIRYISLITDFISAKDQGKHIAERYGSLLPLVSKDHTLDDIEEFVVPLPEKVYILAEHIDDIVKGILQEGPHAKILYRNVLEMAKKGNQASIDFLTSLLNIRRKNNPVILRVFFIPSVVYKEHLAKQDTEHPMHPRVIEEYQKLHMSRFVWIIQVTNMQNYCKEKQEDRQIFGEILIDATANKLGLSYLAIHLPGVLFIRRLEDDYLAKPIFIPDDHPYCIQIR